MAAGLTRVYAPGEGLMARAKPLAVYRICRQVVQGLLGLAACVLLWEALRATGIVSPVAAPSPLAVARAFVNGVSDGALVDATMQTIRIWAVSTCLALLVGVGLGLGTGLSRWMDSLTQPLFEILRPIPAVAVLPVAIIVLGIGPTMQEPIAAFGAMWPLLYGARAGVTEADPMWRDTCRSFGLGKWSYVRRVVLAAALPSILTGLRIAVVVSLTVTVGIEVVMQGGGGLGQYVALAANSGSMVDALSGALAAGILGTVITLAFRVLELRAIPWAEARDK
jgi:NitT/TauT family transport system permease protein